MPLKNSRLGFAAVGLGALGGLAASRSGGWSTPGVVPIAILSLAVLTGVTVALAASQILWALVPVLAVLAGLMIGLDTGVPRGPDMGLATLVNSVAGVLTRVYLVVLDAAAVAAMAEARPPFPIGVRIVGSWVAGRRPDAACSTRDPFCGPNSRFPLSPDGAHD